VILWNRRYHSDSGGIGPHMRNNGSEERLKQMLALCALLLLAGFAVAGPTGVLAWSENATALAARETQIAQLTAKRDALRNRVMLLDPDAADPDLASELVREQLGVMREDEVVITLDEE
jgi:cell division protein FtsB